MVWFPFALLNALAESWKDVCGKLGVRTFPPSVVGWAIHTVAAIVLIPYALTIGLPHAVDRTFVLASVGSAAINTIATLAYMRALRDAPLSQVAPIVTLTPVFLLLTGPIINREYPSLTGAIGVAITVMGTYLLYADARHAGWWRPFVMVWTTPGSRFMLAVAALWSVSAPLDKLAIAHANASAYALTLHTLLAITFIPIAWRHIATTRTWSAAGVRTLILAGIATGISAIAQFTAFSLTLVPYALAIKRTSALFGILWGHLVFHERDARQRVFGATVMVVGAIMILLA